MLSKKPVACRTCAIIEFNEASSLNRTCAYGARLESILLEDPPQNLFDSIGQQRRLLLFFQWLPKPPPDWELRKPSTGRPPRGARAALGPPAPPPRLTARVE